MEFQKLKSEYERLFQGCKINSDKSEAVNSIVDRILTNEERYRKAQNKSGVPWSVIAVIHALESSLNFNTHLHNGDPLSRKTVQVPKGRPPGNPPFTWETSAADALELEKLNIWQDWTIPGALFVLERYNGWGNRKKNINTPYLWSFSNNYEKGKFVADHVFDPEAVSKQCGAAVLLKAMEERGIDLSLKVTDVAPILVPIVEDAADDAENPLYPGRIIKLGENDRAVVRPLQLRLNELGCGDLKGTGFFGNNTEEAVKVFQARFTDNDGRPLEMDGEVGAITWAALFGAETVSSQEIAPSKLMAKALKIAVSQIGIREKPLGSNRGKEVEEYLLSVGLGGGNPWCMAFIYWCFEEAVNSSRIHNPLFKTGHVLTHWIEAGRRNTPRISHLQAINNPALIQPGMIFIIDTGSPGGAGHTGLVEKVIGGKLITIEGNTNDGGVREGIGVFRRQARKIASINKGFIDYGSF